MFLKVLTRAQFLDKIDNQTTIVVHNFSLVGALNNLFNQTQSQKEKHVWERCDVIPWQAWLCRIWTEAFLQKNQRLSEEQPFIELPLLLDPVQEDALWEVSINQHLPHSSVSHINALARLAKKSWNDIKSFDIPLVEIERYSNQDCQSFLDWLKTYQAYCKKNDWIDMASVSDALIENQAVLTLKSHKLLLIGFVDLNQQQRRLLEKMKQIGIRVEWVAIRSTTGKKLKKFVYANQTDECDAVVAWVRGVKKKNPSASVGIVSANLEDDVINLKNSIKINLLRQETNLALNFHRADSDDAKALSFSWPQGVSLSDDPKIHSALLILELLSGKVTIQKVGALLRSPFIVGFESEFLQRSLLASKLESLLEPQVSISKFLWVAKSVSSSTGCEPFYCPIFLTQLEVLFNKYSTLSGMHSPGFFADQFLGCLTILGWPGDADLSADERAVFDVWNDAVRELNYFEIVYPRIDKFKALGLLKRLLRKNKIPLTPNPDGAKVIDASQSFGHCFDYLWVMGLSENNWPKKRRPNPLIPGIVQKKYGVLFAEAETAYLYYQTISRSWVTSSNAICMSFFNNDVNGETFQWSGLLKDLEDHENVESSHEFRLSKQLMSLPCSAFETVKDNAEIPIKSTQVSGGSLLFKLQAACPFRAFTEIRLGAKQQAEPHIGLDKKEQGTLIHNVLAEIWRELKDRQTLINLSNNNLVEFVRPIVVKTVAQVFRNLGREIGQLYEMEVERLVEQVLFWLSIEIKRDDFQVRSIEEALTLYISGLEIKLRIDRIDELENGGLCIIDYKTGVTSMSSWSGDRPDEPQLPLYSQVSELVEAVLFGQLKAGKIKFVGVSRSTYVPGVKALDDRKSRESLESWEDILKNWSEVLTRLGNEFRDGYAAIDPKEINQSCLYCHLGSLCRVGEELGAVEHDGGD